MRKGEKNLILLKKDHNFEVKYLTIECVYGWDHFVCSVVSNATTGRQTEYRIVFLSAQYCLTARWRRVFYE